MNITAEFKNGACVLRLVPVDQWERYLLGAVAKGGEALEAVVTYRADGHPSYGRCEAVQVLLQPAPVQPEPIPASTESA